MLTSTHTQTDTDVNFTQNSDYFKTLSLFVQGKASFSVLADTR